MEYRIHRFESLRAETEKQRTLEELLEMNSIMDELITRPPVLKMSLDNVGSACKKGEAEKIEFNRDGIR